MKKIKYLIVTILLLIIPILVNASGSISVSKNSITIAPGKSGSFVIKANNAAGRVDISSSNTSVATINQSSVWLDNNSSTITVTGKNEGTATITVRTSDAATYDGEVLSSTYTVKITVKAPEVDTRSSNNNLSSLDVEGYTIEKTGDNTFTLTVKNKVDSINIVGTLEDDKATVEGLGTKTLEVGENRFEVLVTAENKSQQIYIIYVTRKDNNFFLEDLEEALEGDEPVEIHLRIDDIIQPENINMIKNSKKKVIMNGNNYSWVLDGNTVEEHDEIKTNIFFKLDNQEEFDEKTGYISGVYLSYENNNKNMNGIKNRIYVGDKYKDGDVLRLYTYKDDEIVLCEEEIKVENGYVEISPIEQNYFLTKGEIKNAVEKKETNIFMITTIIELVVIIGLISFIIIKNNKVFKKNKNVSQTAQNTPKIEDMPALKQEETKIEL